MWQYSQEPSAAAGGPSYPPHSRTLFRSHPPLNHSTYPLCTHGVVQLAAAPDHLSGTSVLSVGLALLASASFSAAGCHARCKAWHATYDGVPVHTMLHSRNVCAGPKCGAQPWAAMVCIAQPPEKKSQHAAISCRDAGSSMCCNFIGFPPW
jgi:hypothetical protein